MSACSVSMFVAATSSPVAAATLGGTATIAAPTGANPPLASGGSETVFTVTLPLQAACSGDTASAQYHVYSYLLPEGTAVTTDDFSTGLPSEGLGLVDASGDYYGPANTAPVSGQIISIPSDFEWAGLLKVGETAAKLEGVWNAGIACADPAGSVTDYWNTEVTFTASSGDPNGFVWSAVPGTGGPTVPGAPTSPTVKGGNKSVTVGWTDPVSNGGSPISGYDVYCSTQGSVSTAGKPSAIASGAAATTATVKKLKTGTKYYCVVTAVNAKGQSPPSPVASTPDSTKTIVGCSPITVDVGSATTCTVTVTDVTIVSDTPTGVVTWNTSGHGSFTGGPTCTLGTGGSCTVPYVPSATGKVTITALFAANGQQLKSSGSFKKLKVKPA